MLRSTANPTEKNQDINLMINKLANSNDIQSYKNTIIKWIEENNKRILVSLEKDRKTYLLMTRTNYLNIFDIIEKYINSIELLEPNSKLSNEKYLKLISFFNILVKFEEVYINKFDKFRSLQLQIKIINILKMYFINKTD